jgi:hypothetical protein
MNQFDKKLMASQSYAVGANNSAPYSADGCKGIRLFVEVTDKGAAGTLVVKLQVQDTVSGQWQDLAGAATASIVAVGRAMLTIFPGITVAANVSLATVLTGPFRVVGTVGTNAVTFSVGAALLD